MAEAQLDFGSNQQTGWAELGGSSQVAMNVIVDGSGAVRRRPGIGAYSGAPSSSISTAAIAHLHVSQPGYLYAVSDSPTYHIYQVTAGGAVDLSVAIGRGLLGSGRPTMTETDALLVYAAGQNVQKLHKASNVSARLGGSPPQATHVIANSSRLVINDIANPNLFWWSDQAAGTDITGHELWTIGVGTAGFATAEARPDPIQAIFENTNELFVFGRTTLELWAPDPNTTYAPVSTIENGLVAPHSVIRLDKAFSWLDHKSQIVVSDGRSSEVISQPIQQQLHDMAASGTVTDAFGYRVVIGTVDALAWTFPSDGRTFVYQIGGGWAQWHGWSGGAFQRFIVNAHHIRFDTAENIVGTTAGRIAKLSMSATDDLGDPIVAFVTTGFENHGTQRRKWCQRVRLVLKRGHTATSSEPVGFLSWRDDVGQWGQEIPISLGKAGDSDAVVEFRSLGVYRQRQWRLRYSGAEDFVLGQALEEFTALEN